ncbi:MAG: hypothetical protein EXR99_12325 [Gemmataceae bacterium]|nr:hypothetical protein [Gemmataceae bacterium]
MKIFMKALAIFSLAGLALAGEVQYIEDFSLAKDRANALKKLIPGTEDYYYFHALHYLNTGAPEKIEPLLKPWHERFGQTPHWTEIQTRRALLSYDNDPQGSLNYLRTRLGLHFNHQKETVGVAPNLPTALDPKLISRDHLLAISFSAYPNLDNLEDSSFDWLEAKTLSWERRRNLLQRLKRPDIAGLPSLIDEDMKSQYPSPFGAFPIHSQLTAKQLEELLQLRGALLNQTQFVQVWLKRLQPGDDSDWRRDRVQTAAYLDRLWAFVSQLAPVHNSLKAHVLYHQLAFDRAKGTYNRERFQEYIKLPRQQGYMAKALLENDDSRRFPANLGLDFSQGTLLPSIGADEPLVRDYLKHFFLDLASPKEFEAYINDIYLRHLFAEAKIEQGLGDPEQWASQLPPELFRQLRERIDIDFAHTNKSDFAANEAVSLDLHIKNVPSLLIKVFEINARNFYRATQVEIATDINLDGLVANTEKTIAYEDSPFRRVARRFEFPQISKHGIYVIDFIGGGKSSRALIHKGRLRPVVSTGPSGHNITVVDENNKQVKDAVAWLGGKEYHPDDKGVILAPFSTAPGRRAVVLSKDNLSSLDFIQHQAEAYALQAGIHIDRESLQTQKTTSILIRPGLTLNGVPVSVKLLEEVRLRITSTDHDGIATSLEVPNFKLFEDRESVHEIRVPARLSSISIGLTAKVKNLSLGKSVDLAAAAAFHLNQIDRTDRIEDMHFAKFGPDYYVELLGRSGEYKPDRPVQLAIKHRDFRNTIHATLKTDSLGRIRLGPLADIYSVSATSPESTSHTWVLTSGRHTYRQVLHAQAGEPITLPHMGTGAQVSRLDYALFEMGGSVIRADRFDSLSIKDGLLVLKGLAAGDYDLWIKTSGDRVRIRVVDGLALAGHVLGKARHMRLPGLTPTQIHSITVDDKDVIIQLTNPSVFSRVHLFATRYLPAFDSYADLAKVRDRELDGMYPAFAESVYLTGRNIGDEFRYVLDRKGQKKYPGNMLERPMLLLNPWAVRSTETGEQEAVGGEEFRRREMNQPAAPAAPPPAKPGESAPLAAGAFANLDFLADASAVAINLVPDKNGVIRVSRKLAGPHAMLHAVAVDPLSTTFRSITVQEQAAKFVDLRLLLGLDPKKHFTQQKQVTVLNKGKEFILEDVAGSRFEQYDSLAKVYALYATLSKDPKLMEFSFLLTWPKMKPEEKRKQYSKYACHELNFFLFKKDPAFFKEAIVPYLANKKDKTFLDLWLLQADLASRSQPWQFDRLNTVERVLLAQKIQGEGPKTHRHLQEMLRLLPPNQERVVLLFDTAVKGGDLGLDDSFSNYRSKLKADSLYDEKLEAKMQTNGIVPTDPATFGRPSGGGGARSAGEMKGSPEGKTAAAKPLLPELEKKSVDSQKRSYDARDGRTKEKFAKDADRKELSEKLMDKAETGKDREKDGEHFFFEEQRTDLLRRQLYRKVDPTLEWAENNYYHLPIQAQVGELVGVSTFWLDYASHDGKTPFISRHISEASRNFTEMMLALAVTELPFEAGKHTLKFEKGKMTLTAASDLIAFHEEVLPAEPHPDKINILVSQNFYRLGDRYRDENGERFDKFVSGEFVVHTVYAAHVVITNPTSSRQKLTVLLQLPVGAIPLSNGQFTKSVLLNLEPYRTQTFDYFFYFPAPGKFTHFPVHAGKSEKYVAAAQPVEFDVVAKPTRLDTGSWDYVSQNGTAAEVLAFLNRENIRALNLEKIAFRLRDKNFFEAVTALLQERHLYHSTTWSYGVYHNLPAAIRQFLLHSEQIIGECGGPITCTLLHHDPVERHHYEHLEYKPLVNARAHSLGQRRQIVNDGLNNQYQKFLKVLSYRTTLNDADRLAVTYYLLAQDRVEESLAEFALVNAERLPTRIQYDYCQAYLALFTDEPDKARAIAGKYAEHPVDRWKATFGTVLAQLDEAQGKGAKVNDPENRDQKQGQLAATEPALEFNLDGGKINLTWQNLESATVNYYLMDVELLFSRNPFVQQAGGQFSYIRPNLTRSVTLPKGMTKTSLPLPEELARKNLLVEITAGGITRSAPWYANAMTVQFIENYGQIKVTESADGKPLSKVYVKVYARNANGEVKFHRDGYTDLRGKFDYATVSTPERTPIQKFSVLVLSDERGALIREVNPPQQ